MLSKKVDVRIFNDVTGALDLDVPLAVQAEAVDPHAILLGIDERLDPAAQLLQRGRVQPAFKDGVLDPFSKVLQRVGRRVRRRSLGTS